MKAYQLTVPADNEPGKLAGVTSILKKEKINIRAITISSFGEKGFFNILVDDPKGAARALQKEGLDVELREVIAALIDDKPGGLDRVVKLLSSAGINVENAYGFVLESWKNAVFVIETKQIDAALELLSGERIKTLSAEALAAVEPFHYMKY